MKTEWIRLLGLVRAEGRSQLSARRTRLAQAELAEPYRRIRRGRLPLTGRVDPDLQLDRQRRRLERAVVAGIVDGQLRHWWIPRAEGTGQTLCLSTEDRPAVLAIIAELAQPSWYLDTVDELGLRAKRFLAGSAAADGAVGAAPGLLVWEFVVATTGSTFAAGETQGLTIYFWDTDPRGRLACQVRNQTATRLPAGAVEGGGEMPLMLQPRPIAAVRFPIDVVYTWVDGADEEWLRSKARAAGIADETLFTERAHDASRFDDHDELRSSLRSLEQFAPWVNHVWIITADQHPVWLAPDHPWVTVVSHRELWPDEDGLPSFNSHAIEACMHRIPGLAEHFLYLNDDMILGRPQSPERFFHPNGIGKFFSSGALVDFEPLEPGEIASSTAAKNARRLLGERYGATFSRKFFHTAAALTVSGMTELEQTFPDTFAATRRASFRTVHDIAAAGSLYLNWGYLTGRLVPGRMAYTYLDPAIPESAPRMRKLSRNRPFDAFCINDGSTEETLDQRRETDRVIRDFLADYLPVPGSFEVATEPALSARRSSAAGSSAPGTPGPSLAGPRDRPRWSRGR